MTTRRRRAVRSFQQPGQPKANPSGLPYGCGSIQMRGRTWWMIYRDQEGRTIQENTKTVDQTAARRMVAERALETARAKVAALEQIIYEAEEAENLVHWSQPDDDGAERGSGSGPVPANPKKRQKRTGAKGGR